jgi:hypothetical protein
MKVIELTRGQSTFVDDADFDFLSQWKWCAHRGRGRLFYAIRTRHKGEPGGGRQIQMHRVVTSAPVGLEVDHINGDTLDNRRQNLRLATHSLNHQNKYQRMAKKKDLPMGIEKHGRGFSARIQIRGMGHYLGTFDTVDMAHQAYVRAREIAILEGERETAGHAVRH